MEHLLRSLPPELAARWSGANKQQMDDAQDDKIELLAERDDEDNDLGDEDDDDVYNEGGALWRPHKRASEDRTKMLQYTQSLPYEAESIEETDARLERIMERLADAIRTKDYDQGFIYWSRCLETVMSLRMPMKREHRVALAKLYYAVATFDGLEPRVIEVAAQICITLLEPVKRIDIYDLQLPWRPLYDILVRELFPKARRTGLTVICVTLLDLCSRAQRFFPPHEARDMLETFLPRFDGTNTNAFLATQSFLIHFLPPSHPLLWLDTVFALWPSLQSNFWDGQWLELIADLAEKHLDPSISNPLVIDDLKRRAAGQVSGDMDVDGEQNEATRWKGIRKDVGIFRQAEWDFLMTKCLRSMGVSVGGVLGSTSMAMLADKGVSAASVSMQKPVDKHSNFAYLIVYSIGPDGQALRDLAKLLRALESFFHPTNYGTWVRSLAHFLAALGHTFARRIHDEAKPSCKTPQAWRLTKEDRREFVKSVITVCLLAVFAKDGTLAQSATSTLRCCAVFEPDLVLPAILDRVYPALEGLLETQRTMSAMSVIASLAPILVDHEIYPSGGKHLVPLADLAIAGLDVNDPHKTLITCLFFCNLFLTVSLEDLTHPDLLPERTDDDVEMNGESDDEQVRNSTAGLPEIVERLLRAMLAVCDNLPEPGKGGKAGGRMEESMVNSLNAVGEFFCASLSDSLFDLALDIFYDHVARSPKANSSRAVGHLAGCFARAHNKKTLDRFVPLCVREIRSEIENGATSTPSTSTASHGETDIVLQWYAYLLGGALSHVSSESLAAHADELAALLKLMAERCKSERGYTHTSRLLAFTVATSLTYFPLDTRPYNAEEMQTDTFRRTRHHMWGKQYEAKDVKVDWHVPGQVEIDYALRIMREILEPLVDQLEQHLQAPRSSKMTDRIWANDFCRRLSVVKASLTAFASLIGMPAADPPGEDVNDRPGSLPEFLDFDINVATGILIPDPSDERHIAVKKLHQRIGRFLHDAATRLKDIGADDSFDTVKMLIATIRVYCNEVPYDHAMYSSAKKNYEFIRNFSRFARGQPKYPRVCWVRRANLYHLTRLKVLSVMRRRTAIDDALIRDLGDLAMSPHVSIRKPAQRGLESFAKTFDGIRTMLQDSLFSALTPGTPADAMKGALHVLSNKQFQNFSIIHWEYGPRYIMALLHCQHQEKESIQKLVSSTAQSFLGRLSEPSNLIFELDGGACWQTADELIESIGVKPNKELRNKNAQQVQRRRSQIDTAWEDLVADLLKLAKDPATHHRYQILAMRFIRSLIRRDKALTPALASFLTQQTMSELPNQRYWAIISMTKILHFVKLRTLANGSPRALLLSEGRNPLKIEVEVPQPVTKAYTAGMTAAFAEPVHADSVLIEKPHVGWLVWGKSFEGYKPPLQEGSLLEWDPPSKPALEVIRKVVLEKAFWDSIVRHLSQELSREYMAADNTVIIKSLLQVFDDDAVLDLVLPIFDVMLVDTDRHKQRAAAEMVGGVLRGSKHWPQAKRDRIWTWLVSKLPALLQAMTAETQAAWEMLVEYAVSSRDPRRNEPLLTWLCSLTLDHRSADPFAQGKIGFLLVSAIKTLSWRFEPWAPKYIELFWNSLDSPFQEVRSAVSDCLHHLLDIQLHPSFPSVDALLQRCESIVAADLEPLLLDVTDEHRQRATAAHQQLETLRATRKPLASGEQAYDETSLTLMNWIYAAAQDARLTPIYPFITTLLPDFFAMQDIQDNEELNSTARNILMTIAILPYPKTIVNTLLRALAELLATSPAWRLRLNVLPVLQVIVFYQLFEIEDDLIVKLLDLVCGCLRDATLEVREQASKTLSALVRCSQGTAIVHLKDRFLGLLRTTRLPKRRDSQGQENAGYGESLTAVHSAVLGASALVSAFPYTVPDWLPSLLLEVGAAHASSPAPISTAVKKMLADFKSSHQDSWSEDQKAFTPDQLTELNDLYQGGSYYA